MEPDVLQALRADARVASVLDELGHRTDVWVVGGAVRDALLGRPPRDLDLSTEADPVALGAQLGEIVAEHERFGTVEIRRDDLDVGVVRARTETYAEPGALPDVTPASLEEDLRRRDFTINAVAVDLAGVLHGAGSWREDLAAGLVRVLHERSFLDDPTRLWRAARYAARLGHGLEPETGRLAREAVSSGALESVTGPRLGAELQLALGEPDPGAALGVACDLGLLPVGVSPRPDVVRDALDLLGDDAGRGALTLAAMTHGMSAVQLRAWLDDLGVPARLRNLVVHASAGADVLGAGLARATRPSEIAALARTRASVEVAVAGAAGPAGALEAARSWLADLRHVRLDIGGDDLLAAGVPQGPELGERLGRALAARLDGEAGDRVSQLAAALA